MFLNAFFLSHLPISLSISYRYKLFANGFYEADVPYYFCHGYENVSMFQ